jgi:SOS response regulatory protein OraA/RecX
MDQLGEVIRNQLKQVRANNVHNARVLAMDLRSEGMTKDQIEEMLYANGFEGDIIDEAIQSVPAKKAK